MKEYSRRITGVIDTRYGTLTIDDQDLKEMLSKALGEDRLFAGTLSICITDLSEDTGAPEAATAPEEGGQD